MANELDLKSAAVSGRAIDGTDVMVAFDPSAQDSAAAKTDPVAEVIGRLVIAAVNARTSGTIDAERIDAALVRDSELTAAVEAAEGAFLARTVSVNSADRGATSSDLRKLIRFTTGDTNRSYALPAGPSEGDVVGVRKVDSGSGHVVVSGGGSTFEVEEHGDVVVFKWNGGAWEIVGGTVDAFARARPSDGGVTSFAGLTGRATTAQLPDGVSIHPLFLDGGKLNWANRVYTPRSVARHNGVIYLCIRSTQGVNRSVTEPGVGTAWQTYWVTFDKAVTPLIRNLFDGMTGTTVTERQIPGVTVRNSANTAYSLRVGSTTVYMTGSVLYAKRANDPLQVDHVNLYSKGGGDAGKLFHTLDSAQDKVLEIWEVADLAAIQSVVQALGGELPATNAGDAGRILALGSNLQPFWDLESDVLVRALPSLSGNAGKLLAINSDEDEVILVDPPAGGGADATARAAAAAADAKAEANEDRLDSVDYVVDTYAVAMRALSGLTIDSWANAGDPEAEAGFGIGYWEQGGRPTAYGDVTWSVSHADLPASTGYFVVARVPSGFPVKFLRVSQVRQGVGSFAWPGEDESWLPITLTGTPEHFETFAIYDSPTALTGIEANANDDLVLQVAGLLYFDALPGLSQSVRELHDLVDSVVESVGVVSNFESLADNGHYRQGYAVIQSDGTEASAGGNHTTNVNPLIWHAIAAGNRIPAIWTPAGTNPLTRRIVHRRSGVAIATYPRNGEYWRSYDSTVAALNQVIGHFDPWFLASETSDAPIAVAIQEGDQFVLQAGELEERLAIPASALASAVASRLLPAPTASNAGSYVRISSDGSRWEVVAAPSGGSGGLNQDQVDARVVALIRGQAFKTDNSAWQAAKIPDSIARDSEVAAAIAGVRQLPAGGIDGQYVKRVAGAPAWANIAEGEGPTNPGGAGLQMVGTWRPSADVDSPASENNQATGIRIPLGADDNDIFMFAARWDSGLPVFRPVTGKFLKGLSVSSAGTSASQGNDDILTEDAGANSGLYGERTAAGELLLSNDGDGFTAADDYFILYRLGEGTGEIAEANPAVSVIRPGTARNRSAGTSRAATPFVTVPLTQAGTSLAASYASDLDTAGDTVTLKAGIYVASIQMGVYAAASGTNRLVDNKRFNIDYRVRKGGTVVSHPLSNAYLRPISDNGAEDQYGGLDRSVIFRIDETGPIEFQSHISGVDNSGYLQTASIEIYRIGGVTVEGRGASSEPGRLEALEEKVSEVAFDDTPEWIAEPNAAVAGKFPYGKFRFIAHGDEIASYANLDYNAATFHNAGFTVAAAQAAEDAGIVFVASNETNWSRTRITVRDGTGALKFRFTVQSLRNMPAARQSAIRNLPASPPDVTARWPATSNTDVHALGSLAQGDTVALEVLEAEHIPIWQGLLTDAVMARLLPSAPGRSGDQLSYNNGPRWQSPHAGYTLLQDWKTFVRHGSTGAYNFGSGVANTLLDAQIGPQFGGFLIEMIPNSQTPPARGTGSIPNLHAFNIEWPYSIPAGAPAAATTRNINTITWLSADSAWHHLQFELGWYAGQDGVLGNNGHIIFDAGRGNPGSVKLRFWAK